MDVEKAYDEAYGVTVPKSSVYYRYFFGPVTYQDGALEPMYMARPPSGYEVPANCSAMYEGKTYRMSSDREVEWNVYGFHAFASLDLALRRMPYLFLMPEMIEPAKIYLARVHFGGRVLQNDKHAVASLMHIDHLFSNEEVFVALFGEPMHKAQEMWYWYSPTVGLFDVRLDSTKVYLYGRDIHAKGIRFSYPTAVRHAGMILGLPLKCYGDVKNIHTFIAISQMKDRDFRKLIPSPENQTAMYYEREVEPHKVLLDLLVQKE
jgi:hypothetical protein